MWVWVNARLLTIAIAAFFIGIHNAFGGFVTHDFVVRYFYGAPDGVYKPILGVNNQFPGPTIRATIGDTLVVRVTNLIQTRENTSIHWHGMEQVLTPFEDGPEMVTQCPIVYGATQVYSFKLQQSGTYWWHSHHFWQYTQGYWGLLIIDNPPEVYRDSYHGEFTISFNDWYHKPGQELIDWYLSPASRGNEPIPDSGLLNGRGSYPCSQAWASGYDCSTAYQANRRPYVFIVERFKTYRIRVINTSAFTPFVFSIDGHKLETIEVDGVDTVRAGPVDNAFLAAAQRYSFLVRMNASVGPWHDGFWIRANASTGAFKPNPNINPYPDKFEREVKAILRYRSRDNVQASAPFASEADFGSDADGVTPLNGESPPQKSIPPPGTQGRPETHGIDWGNLNQVIRRVQIQTDNNSEIIKIIQTQQRQNSRNPKPSNVTGSAHLRWPPPTSTSGFPTTQPTTPALSLNPNLCRPYPGDKLAPESFDELVTINVDFVNGSDGVVRGKMNGVSYQIGEKPVIFQILKDEPIPGYVNPIPITLGKVIQLVVNNHGSGGHPFHLHGHTFWVMGGGGGDYNATQDEVKLKRDGVRRDTTGVGPHSWAVIRFKADNPGPWLFHCHINWHLQSGLGVVLIEGADICRIIYQVPRAAANVCKAARIDIT